MMRWLGFALAAVLAAVSAWLGVTVTGQRQTMARLESEVRQARSALASARSETPRPQAVPRPAAPAETARPHSFESSANPEADLLRARLQQTKESMDTMSAQVQQLQAQVKQLTDERARATATETEMRTRLDEVTHTVNSVSAERAALGKRVGELESANVQLRDAMADTTRRNAQFAQFAADLEDVARRQQVYLNNILRRYREVTELFRAFPAVVENRGNGAEISRINSALQMADEDFRQLNDLTARLTRVQRQLTTAVAKKQTP